MSTTETPTPPSTQQSSQGTSPRSRGGSRVRYVFQEALIGLRRNMLMTVAVILSVTVSLMLLGAALLVRDQVQLAAGNWYGKIEISIYLCDERGCGSAITPDQRASLEDDLRNDPLVADVFYESKREAYENFRNMFADQPDFVESVTPEALPASFRVKLQDPDDVEAIEAVIQKYGARPGVEEVVDLRETLRPFFTLMGLLRVGTLVLAFFLLLVAAVLIVNTVRVAAFARRDQTAIMKLVGASNWYIRLPFIMEGALAGFIGALLAWGVLLAVVPWLAGVLRANVQFMPFIGLEEALRLGYWLVPTGVFIAAISSLIALRRFLDV